MRASVISPVMPLLNAESSAVAPPRFSNGTTAIDFATVLAFVRDNRSATMRPTATSTPSMAQPLSRTAGCASSAANHRRVGVGCVPPLGITMESSV